MTAKQLSRVPTMTEDETEREQKGPRLLLPLPSNVIALQSTDRREKLRIVEALLFAASEPLKETELARHFGQDEDVKALLEELQGLYAGRGVNLVRVAGKWRSEPPTTCPSCWSARPSPSGACRALPWRR